MEWAYIRRFRLKAGLRTDFRRRIQMMKHFSKIAILATVCCLHISCSSTSAKAQTFQQRTATEKQAYVGEKAHRISAAITGRPSDLSPAYLALVAARVEAYAERIGANTQGADGQEDMLLVLDTGAKYAA